MAMNPCVMLALSLALDFRQPTQLPCSLPREYFLPQYVERVATLRNTSLVRLGWSETALVPKLFKEDSLLQELVLKATGFSLGEKAASDSLPASGGIIGFLIGVDGVPVSCTIRASSSRLKSDALIKQVARLRFDPARIAGKPVAQLFFARVR